MKKFFKSLAVVLALALVITSVPATAASAASVSLKSKTVTLYSEPSTGKTEDGKVCKSYNFWKIAKLLNNFDAETMDIKLVSEDTDLVQKSNKKDMIWVADGASFGTTKVKVIVTSLSTEKVLLEKSITVKVKKNATEDTFKCDLENGSEFEVGETVAVTLSRKNTDTDARKLTCADDSVEIVDANGYGTKYNVTFTKAGKFTLVASAYQSAKYPAPTVEKEIEVVVTSDFAASATGAREITVVGSGLTKDITVKRANVTVSADDVKVSDDKTTAVITLASKITDATYTVIFGEQSVDFVGEKQRVEEIVLLDDGEYVSTGKEGDGANEKQLIYVHYDVLDQYGDSVRANTDITWSVSTGNDFDKDLKNGVLTLRVAKANALHYGAVVIITGTYANNGNAKSVTGQVNVGLEISVDTVELIDVMNTNTNAKVEILPADFEAGEFGFTYKMYDKSGYPMDYTDELAEDLTFTSQSTLLVQQVIKSDTKTIDGVTYGYVTLTPGVNADKGGVAELLIISKKTGNKSYINIEINSAQVVDSFNFYAPDSYVKGDKEVTLEYEAYDADGNKVTNFNALVNSVSFTNPNFFFRKQNDGTALLRYDGTYGESTTQPNENFNFPDTCVIILSNGQTINKTIEVRDWLKVAAVKGFESWVNTNIVEGDTFTLYNWELLYIDNYDRVINKDKIGNTKLTVQYDPTHVDVSFMKASNRDVAATEGVDYGEIAGTENLYWFNNGTVAVDFVAKTDVTASDEDVNFVLGVYDSEENKVLAGSEKTCTITINDITQCTSFAFEGHNVVKYYTDYTYLNLAGYLSNGAKVDSIPKEYWVVAAPGGNDHYSVLGSVSYDENGIVTDETVATSGAIIKAVKYNVEESVNASGAAIKSDFIDYSVTKADGTHPSRKQSFEISAKVYDVYNENVANRDIVRDTVKYKITTATDAKKDVEIKVVGENAVVQATNGEIKALALLQAAVRNVKDNYENSFSNDFNPWDGYEKFVSYTDDTQIKVTVSKVVENVNGNPNDHIKVAENGVQENVTVLVDAEIGDTFIVTFTTAKGSVSVNFTVGADTEAYWSNDSHKGTEKWF